MSAFFGPGGNSQAFYNAGFKSTIDAPRFVRSIGLNAYEYEAGNGIAASLETLYKIGKAAKEQGIKMSFHTPYFISLSGVEEEKRLKSIKYIADSLDAAYALGAGTIVVHTGSAAKISREEAMRLCADTIAKTLAAVDTRGIRIGLETMGKINQLGTLEEVLDICSLDKRLCPVIDFGHLNARELGGVFITKDDYLRVFDLIASKLGAEYLDSLHCHFSKIEWSKSGEKRHLTFEDSIYGPDFEPLMEVIAREDLSPRIICESDGTMAEDALKMKTYYSALREG